jgi:hypothetical protein
MKTEIGTGMSRNLLYLMRRLGFVVGKEADSGCHTGDLVLVEGPEADCSERESHTD